MRRTKVTGQGQGKFRGRPATVRQTTTTDEASTRLQQPSPRLLVRSSVEWSGAVLCGDLEIRCCAARLDRACSAARCPRSTARYRGRPNQPKVRARTVGYSRLRRSGPPLVPVSAAGWRDAARAARQHIAGCARIRRPSRVRKLCRADLDGQLVADVDGDLKNHP